MEPSEIELAKSFNSVINYEGVLDDDVQSAFEILTAQHYAYSLSIPVEPLQEVYDYWRVTHQNAVSVKLAAINEIRVIEFDSTLNLCYEIWLLRYSLVHRANYRHINLLMNCACKTMNKSINEFYVKTMATYPTLGVFNEVKTNV